MADTEELKNRIEAKKFEFKKELAELKADSSGDKRDRIESLEAKLTNLEDYVREGWEGLSESMTDKLNSWLKDA